MCLVAERSVGCKSSAVRYYEDIRSANADMSSA